MRGWTHAGLVEAAAKWLARAHSVVATEVCADVGEVPDALGWRGWRSTLVECKASREDFAADRRKLFREHPQLGVGCARYYLAPRGLLSLAELPPRWGLLEADGRGVRVAKASGWFGERNERAEVRILVSALRRAGTGAPGVSVKMYSTQTKCRATLGTDGGFDMAPWEALEWHI